MSSDPSFIGAATPQRVAVALSGGVDSAVTAALLRREGHEVVALTMLLQKTDRPDDAASVARALEIEHHILDLTDTFYREVMQPFAQSYLAGETPIPCARCNRLIKFGALMDKAREIGAGALATGHYARRIVPENGGHAQLHTGADAQRDQSYFLYGLSQEQLDFMRMPLGGWSKAETRQQAAAFGLSVADKKDSQDICFVPCGDYAAVVERLCAGSSRAGNIVDQAGRVLGTHDGIIHYTVGQRKGLNLSDRKGDHNEPLFVLQLDPLKNEVIVGPREALARQRVLLREVNWLADDLLAALPEDLTVRLRSSQKPMPCSLDLDPKTASGQVILNEPVLGVAKGQAGVLYSGTRLLGGGTIDGARGG